MTYEDFCYKKGIFHHDICNLHPDSNTCGSTVVWSNTVIKSSPAHWFVSLPQWCNTTRDIDFTDYGEPASSIMSLIWSFLYMGQPQLLKDLFTVLFFHHSNRLELPPCGCLPFACQSSYYSWAVAFKNGKNIIFAEHVTVKLTFDFLDI